jgi:3-isopropylmalate/(R)-2-methylmalate dehydratase small subunit
LPIFLSKNEIEYLFHLVDEKDATVEVSLQKQTVSISEKTINFDIDSTRKKMLLEGMDEIGFTLRFNDRILNYEKASKIVDYNKYLV